VLSLLLSHSVEQVQCQSAEFPALIGTALLDWANPVRLFLSRGVQDVVDSSNRRTARGLVVECVHLPFSKECPRAVMKHVNLDTADESVKQFVLSLSVEGVARSWS
jgi:hypothetical protein